jgi:hypothetical protein
VHGQDAPKAKGLEDAAVRRLWQFGPTDDTVHTETLPKLTLRWKTRRLPLGDQAGLESNAAVRNGFVSSLIPLPSEPMIAI